MRFSFLLMIRLPCINTEGSVYLLQKNHPHKLVREGHGGEA